jgi:hypothetical protein
MCSLARFFLMHKHAASHVWTFVVQTKLPVCRLRVRVWGGWILLCLFVSIQLFGLTKIPSLCWQVTLYMHKYIFAIFCTCTNIYTQTNQLTENVTLIIVASALENPVKIESTYHTYMHAHIYSLANPFTCLLSLIHSDITYIPFQIRYVVYIK